MINITLHPNPTVLVRLFIKQPLHTYIYIIPIYIHTTYESSYRKSGCLSRIFDFIAWVFSDFKCSSKAIYK